MSNDPIRVHRTKCRGYGICADLLPERIRLDEWGYPIVDPQPIPEHLREVAALAVRECPTAALIFGAPTEDG